jgi:hypothetical protein
VVAWLQPDLGQGVAAEAFFILTEGIFVARKPGTA